MRQARSPGDQGDGDALVTQAPRLGLAIQTADCVPILIGGPDQVAAIHAGWRGIERGIVSATVACFAAPSATTAWVGPAIGPCCYEVGEEVAARVARASNADVIEPRSPRPHVDLRGAVRHQLHAAGIEQIHITEICTRCDRGWSSHRRDAAAAGRNVAVIWLDRG